MTSEPNPVLLYELRQAVRNRAVLTLMLVYIAVLSVFFGAVVMTGDKHVVSQISSWTGGLVGSWGINTVTNVAMIVLTIYYVFTSLALIAFAIGRTTGDRLHENPIFYSPFAPWRIVLGKLLFGIVISLFFLSLTLPFLAAAYWMRGVDIRVMFTGALLYFGMTQWHYFATVAFYSGAKSPVRVFFVSLPLFSIHLILSLSVAGVPSLAAEMWYDDNIWIFFMFAGLFLTLMFLAFLLSWVQYAPENSNRMLPVRVSLSIIQGFISLAFVIGLIYHYFTTGDLNDPGFELAYILFGIFVPCFFPIMICEREKLSYRIRRKIPQAFWRRLLVFPFYTGIGGAMIWIFSVILLEGFLLLLVLGFFPASISSGHEYAEIAHPFSYGLLCFDYCATVVILHRLALHRWMSRQWNWLPLFVLLALPPLFIVVMILIEMLTPISVLHWFFDDDRYKLLFFMPIPWPSMDRDFANHQLYLAVSWAVIIAPITLVQSLCRFREFRPPQIDETQNFL